ncbi:MAG: hypothetical protein KQ78_01774 [Candidatus Izimaplasma bacterium HR2]|nr:MAG: hypothetical protein KQ78_01774 [Candidatus Izimaplasma bacterium HR2]
MKLRKHIKRRPINRGKRYEYKVFLVNGREFLIYAIDEKEVIQKLKEIGIIEIEIEIESITKIKY